MKPAINAGFSFGKSRFEGARLSQFAEKLASFEGAQLQLCHKSCKTSPALAAEGWFFFLLGFFSQAVSTLPLSRKMKFGLSRRGKGSVNDLVNPQGVAPPGCR